MGFKLRSLGLIGFGPARTDRVAESVHHHRSLRVVLSVPSVATRRIEEVSRFGLGG